MAPLPRHYLTTGQVGEWLVWAHIANQSGGDLHVFLPTLDRGIDGFVRRISTDTYTPVQVKARTTLDGHSIAFELTKPELANPAIQVVVVQLDPATSRLGPRVLLVGAATLRRHAHWMARAQLYSVTVPLEPPARSHWAKHWVSLDELSNRLSPPELGLPPAAHVESVEDRQRHGYQAELALITACIEQLPLNVFRAAPDCEFVEYLVYNVDSHRVLGLQVKSISIPVGDTHGVIRIRRKSFRASDHAYLVAFALERESGDVLGDCLLIPATQVLDVATAVTATQIAIKWSPASWRRSRLGPFRLRRKELGARLESLLRGSPQGSTLPARPRSRDRHR